MNRLFHAVGLFMILSGGLLHAQTINALATVPFDFRVGNTVMPAGDYQVKSHDQILQFRRIGGGPSAMVLSIPTLRNHATEPKLEFHKYGSVYFLSKVWGSDQEGKVLNTSPAEKELLRASTLVQTANADLKVK